LMLDAPPLGRPRQHRRRYLTCMYPLLALALQFAFQI
jgi:hypothetical protein